MRRREIDAALRRDRRVLRRRALHRHAGQALLERHVRAARASRSPRTSSPRSCSSTRCSRSATRSSSASASARCTSSRPRRADGPLRQPQPARAVQRLCSRVDPRRGRPRSRPRARSERRSSGTTSSERRPGAARRRRRDPRRQADAFRQRAWRGSACAATRRTGRRQPDAMVHLGQPLTGRRRRSRSSRPIPDAILEVGHLDLVDGQRVATAYIHGGGRRRSARARASHESAPSSSVALLPGEYALDLGLHEWSQRRDDRHGRARAALRVGVSDGEGADPMPPPSARLRARRDAVGMSLRALPTRRSPVGEGPRRLA